MANSIPELSGDSRETLAKAALLESPFPIQFLVASGSPPESLDTLFDSGLLEETDAGEARFACESTRKAVTRDLAWSKRRRLCQLLAETCLSLSSAPEQVARLYHQAQDHAAARANYLKAAQLACQSHDYPEALRLMQAVFEIWPIDQEPQRRRQALKEMARCAQNCSEHDAAHLSLTELLEMAEREGNAAERIELNRLLAQSAAALGDRPQARERLRAAALLAEASGLVQQSGRLWRQLAQLQGDALRLRDALATLAQAQHAARRCQDWAILSDALAYRAMLTAMLGRIGEARKLLDQALQLAIERDLPEQITNAYRRQANISEYASNYEAYRDTELAALDRCRSLDQQRGAQACLACVSYAFFRLGQYPQSLAAADEALATPDLHPELEAGARSVKACIDALRKVTPEIIPNLDEAGRSNRMFGARVFEFYTLWAKGAHATLTRQDELARLSFLELIDLWKETDDRKDAVPGLLCAAAFFAEESDAARLASCTDILNTIVSDSESLEPRAASIATQAEDAWRRGNAKEAERSFMEASKAYRDLKLPFEQAWILWRMGHVQRHAGSSAEAALSWRSAVDIARPLSLKPLLRAIARERSASETSPQQRSPLTPRQLEIARLVAAGRSNKEAAAALGISPRTVEMHVAALIERLGCRSRAEAARQASELGLL